jgi:hypothetical protein
MYRKVYKGVLYTGVYKEANTMNQLTTQEIQRKYNVANTMAAEFYWNYMTTKDEETSKTAFRMYREAQAKAHAYGEVLGYTIKQVMADFDAARLQVQEVSA